MPSDEISHNIRGISGHALGDMVPPSHFSPHRPILVPTSMATQGWRRVRKVNRVLDAFLLSRCLRVYAWVASSLIYPTRHSLHALDHFHGKQRLDFEEQSQRPRLSAYELEYLEIVSHKVVLPPLSSLVLAAAKYFLDKHRRLQLGPVILHSKSR